MADRSRIYRCLPLLFNPFNLRNLRNLR